MSSMFNAIMGKQSDPYAEIQLPSNQPIDPAMQGGTNNDVLGRYLEEMRQRTANLQAGGRATSPIQNVLYAYDLAAGTPLPAPTTAIRPIRSPETTVDKPQPVQMPTPSPLLQSNGGLKRLFQLMASGG